MVSVPITVSLASGVDAPASTREQVFSYGRDVDQAGGLGVPPRRTCAPFTVTTRANNTKLLHTSSPHPLRKRGAADPDGLFFLSRPCTQLPSASSIAHTKRRIPLGDVSSQLWLARRGCLLESHAPSTYATPSSVHSLSHRSDRYLCSIRSPHRAFRRRLKRPVAQSVAR